MQKSGYCVILPFLLEIVVYLNQVNGASNRNRNHIKVLIISLDILKVCIVTSMTLLKP